MTTLYPQPPPEIVAVTFELIHPNAKAPTRATPGSAGWDLYACHEAFLEDRCSYIVGTGIKVSIPEGYEIQVRPRSSLAKFGVIVINSPGTIDSDYRGEVKVLMMSIDGQNEGIHIRSGERIAQLVIAPVPRVQFVQGVVINNTERGEGSFGSSGK